MIKITVIVDRYGDNEKYVLKRGLAVFIETKDNYILFDLGPDSESLQKNAEKIGIDLELLDGAVISHIHSSHIGGINALGWSSPFLKVLIPFDSMKSIGRIVKNNGLVPIEVLDWLNPWSQIYVTPPVYGPPWEHFLIIDTPKGLIVFSGCMHPGLRKTISVIKKRFRNKKIYALIGGLHLENALETYTENTLQELIKINPEKIIPLHCSGLSFIKRVKGVLGNKVLEAKIGTTIKL
ncbi:MAG: MBL fold metallo-hydrolase [Staphylothermus sp.]|nr:MBL fold metallo-hydrolase [Staphylothermus sp.]